MIYSIKLYLLSYLLTYILGLSFCFFINTFFPIINCYFYSYFGFILCLFLQYIFLKKREIIISKKDFVFIIVIVFIISMITFI